MLIEHCANVQEAVKLAERFRREGMYDLFRGQVEDWPPCSTFARRGPDEAAKSVERLLRFTAWVRRTPGLQAIAGDDLAIDAVAQHYGIDTNLIDFTTDPRTAGFFASHNRSPTASRESSILCLKRAHLVRFAGLWAELDRLRFYASKIPNLWRLEAQSGVFLFCPYASLENVYDIDKIVFPYRGPVNEPRVAEIYPERKSALEVLLDQYFDRESLARGHSMLATWGATWIECGNFDEEATPFLRLKAALRRHDSWNVEASGWFAFEEERIEDAPGAAEIALVLESGQSGVHIVAAVAAQVRQRLADDPQLRRSLARWRLVDTGFFSGLGWEATCEPALARLWDGTRRLPYTDDEVSQSMGVCVALAQTGLDGNDGRPCDNRQRAAAVFGRSVEVALGAPDGSSSRALVSRAALRSAFRADLPDLAQRFGVPVAADEDVYPLLGIIPDPRLVFDFRRLVTLFANEIVPTQVLLRGPPPGTMPSSMPQRRAIYYSPARIDILRQP